MAAAVNPGKHTCSKCNSVFNTLSELKKHQWANHQEIFKNLKKSAKLRKGKKWTPEQKEKFSANLAARRAAKNNALETFHRTGEVAPYLYNTKVAKNGLSAIELLGKLKEQQKFLNDTVALISGIIGQHLEVEKHRGK